MRLLYGKPFTPVSFVHEYGTSCLGISVVLDTAIEFITKTAFQERWEVGPGVYRVRRKDLPAVGFDKTCYVDQYGGILSTEEYESIIDAFNLLTLIKEIRQSLAQRIGKDIFILRGEHIVVGTFVCDQATMVEASQVQHEPGSQLYIIPKWWQVV